MPKITELFAFVMADSGPDDEGVPAFMYGDTPMPMMGADVERVESLRQVAQHMATMYGKEIRIVKSNGPLEEIAVIRPEGIET